MGRPAGPSRREKTGGEQHAVSARRRGRSARSSTRKAWATCPLGRRRGSEPPEDIELQKRRSVVRDGSQQVMLSGARSRRDFDELTLLNMAAAMVDGRSTRTSHEALEARLIAESEIVALDETGAAVREMGSDMLREALNAIFVRALLAGIRHTLHRPS
jgi:hypothetical protein